MAVSAGGSLGRTHYATGKYIVSNLCFVLIEKDHNKYPINLEFYNYYFSCIREQLVDDLADGTSKLTIGEDALYDYYIDYVPIEIQNKFVNESILEYKKILNALKQAKNQVQSNIRNIIK